MDRDGASASSFGGGWVFVAYAGPSMNPTLRAPEVLEVQPYGHLPVRAGDVVMLRRPDDGRCVVHRVVAVSAAGLRTRGDNNRDDDIGFTSLSDVQGRVVAAWRGSVRRPVAGGRRGMAWHRLLRLRRRLLASALCSLRLPYRALARPGLLHRLVPSSFRPRVLVFTFGNEARARLFLGGRDVGTYDPVEKLWRIRQPYRLLVDESALPPCPPDSPLQAS